jgi:ribosomal protein S18 acetylase RimI-like enzyme
MLQIRVARLDDHESIEALWREALLPTVSAEEWETLIASTAATVLVAENESGLVGTAVASFDGWRANIYHVAVDPVSRHHGVASALMREGQSILASKGARVIYVLVHEANTQGLALVAAAGYEPELGEMVLKRELPAPVAAWS